MLLQEKLKSIGLPENLSLENFKEHLNTLTVAQLSYLCPIDVNKRQKKSCLVDNLIASNYPFELTYSMLESKLSCLKLSTVGTIGDMIVRLEQHLGSWNLQELRKLCPSDVKKTQLKAEIINGLFLTKMEFGLFATKTITLRIPKNVRIDVWNKWIGKEIGQLKCPLCNIIEIQQGSCNGWDCGHIIAKSHGGDISIENLRVICKSCNSSMGSHDMRDYCNKYSNMYPRAFERLQITDTPISVNPNVICDSPEVQTTLMLKTHVDEQIAKLKSEVFEEMKSTVDKVKLRKKISIIEPILSGFNFANSQSLDNRRNSKLYNLDCNRLFIDHVTFTECLYDQNRSINPDRVRKIRTELIKNPEYLLSGICTIGLINWTNPKILDGQHRLSAALNFGQKVYGYVKLISFHDADEMNEYYININSSEPLPDFYKSSDIHKKNCIELVTKQLETLFPNVWSDSKRCLKPKLNVDNVKESLYKIYNETAILKPHINNDLDSSVKKIVGDLTKFNNFLKTQSLEYFKCSSSPKTIECAHKTVILHQNPCLIGLLFTLDNSSGFVTKYTNFI
jgi:hypothetical protein